MKTMMLQKLILFSIFVLFFNIQSVFTIDDVSSSKSDNETIDIFAEYENRVCNGKPICNVTFRPKNQFAPCMCDSKCNSYGDCCLDSPYFNTSQKQISKNFICPKNILIYMVKSCSNTVMNTTEKLLCENVTAGEVNPDPNVMKPVLDAEEKIMYYNIYCARCNNRSFNNLESTILTYSCDYDLGTHSNSTEIFKNMRFDSEKKQFWTKFEGVDIKCRPTLVMPDKIALDARPCIPDLISSCAADYKNQTVIDKCNSYTSVVSELKHKNDGKVFKNEYCATCNGWTRRLYKCQLGALSRRTGGGGSALFSTIGIGSDGISCEDDGLASKFC